MYRATKIFIFIGIYTFVPIQIGNMNLDANNKAAISTIITIKYLFNVMSECLIHCISPLLYASVVAVQYGMHIMLKSNCATLK